MNDRRHTEHTKGTQASAVSLQEDDYINSHDSSDKMKDISYEDLDSSTSKNTRLL